MNIFLMTWFQGLTSILWCTFRNLYQDISIIKRWYISLILRIYRKYIVLESKIIYQWYIKIMKEYIWVVKKVCYTHKILVTYIDDISKYVMFLRKNYILYIWYIFHLNKNVLDTKTWTFLKKWNCMKKSWAEFFFLATTNCPWTYRGKYETM